MEDLYRLATFVNKLPTFFIQTEYFDISIIVQYLLDTKLIGE